MSVIWFVDTETGGTDPNFHSILSVGLVRWEAGVITEQAEWYVYEEPMIVTREAMQVNGINVADSSQRWLSPVVVANSIYGALCKYGENDSKYRPMLGGHNTSFDIRFLERLHRLANNARYPFSYRYVDTMSVACFLLDIGLIDVPKVSLEELCKYFGIETGLQHSALADAVAAALVYTCFVKMVRDRG